MAAERRDVPAARHRSDHPSPERVSALGLSHTQYESFAKGFPRAARTYLTLSVIHKFVMLLELDQRGKIESIDRCAPHGARTREMVAGRWAAAKSFTINISRMEGTHLNIEHCCGMK
jgi:hypothetical protein